MSEGMNLVTELAIILISAGVFTVIFKALKQPLVLGYIVAGFLVGPHLGLFPQFSSAEVHQWSDIGIIFLLFGLGLEFSFKKLMQVGLSAVIAAAIKCTGMFLTGMIVGDAMGWPMLESVFLGGLLSISSTTIIVKAYGDMGLKNKPYAGFIFGEAVVEDLVAVLMLVLLSTMAASNKFAGGEMILALAKLIFFLVLWFIVGIYVIPTALKRAKKYFTDEILLLVSIGLCFLMVVLATFAGFSSALGAFVMGSILSSTLEGVHIEKLISPVKDLFGAIFFVSVGMMVDPSVIAAHWMLILGLTVTVILGVIVFSTAGFLIAGAGLKTAVHAGFTLAQLGEFAFIIAGLGCSLGVLRDFIYPVVIAVSVITAFTTPYMIKLSGKVYDLLEKRLPERIFAKLTPRRNVSGVSRAERNEWSRLLKLYALRLGVYGVLLFSIVVISVRYLGPLVARVLPAVSSGAVSWISVALTFIVMCPFLYGMAIHTGKLQEVAEILLRKNRLNRWPLMGMIVFRFLLAAVFVVLMFTSHLKLSWLYTLLVLVVAIVAMLLVRGVVMRFFSFEERFYANLNQKEEHEKVKAPVTAEVREKMQGLDVQIEQVPVPPGFQYAGSPLREMPFRRTAGVNIVKIQRAGHSILTPSGSEIIFPGDILVAVGTAEQIASFKKIIGENIIPPDENQNPFEVEKILLGEDSVLSGRTLRESDVRGAGCTVISVLRDGEVITNPSPDMRLRPGDYIWLAGEESAVNWFK